MPLSEPEILQYLMQARQRILAAAWTVVRDTHVAEDVFQKMAVKAVTRDVSFETDSALLSWAFISVRCEGIDYLRKHKRETVGFEPDILELLEADWQLEKAAPAGARIEALRDCVEELPERSSQLLRLRYFEGHNCDEISRKMNVGLDAIYKRLSRLHGALKECIETKLETI